MADMGIYSLWPVFDVLALGSPVSAEALASHTCEIVGTVSRVRRNDVAYPTACMQRLQFAASGDSPAIELFWYDGGMKPRLPEEVEAHDVEMQREGILFVGDEG
ncbi:TPA: gfo/Idh/MocA family oxidoreductase, partial [Candidatus Bipolaricaulota bacterium]|nr:gfo/Idh/MocA family oxidoreductase [Candidatus Bipolaricaulota bacterium]